MNALDKANRDSRLQSLRSEVEKQVKISFIKSNGDGWGSNLEGTLAKVWWTGCRHPSASMAHELLHIKLQLRGYRRIRISISNMDEPESTKTLMDCIDNEFQHHKIYAEFISLGFKPEQFYCDSDSETAAHLEQIAKNGFSSRVQAATNFLSLIAPGGLMPPATTATLRQSFDAIDSGSYSILFRNIELIMASWVADETLDSTEYVRRLCLEIKANENLTWYGFAPDERPSKGDGVFVGERFEVME